MSNHFWQGESISDTELKIRVLSLNSYILKGHSSSFNLDEFYRAGDRFSKKLAADEKLRTKLMQVLIDSGESNSIDASIALIEIMSFIEERSLRAKVNAEFGSDNPFRSQKVSRGEPIFESWFPLGFLVQFLAANSPSLAVLSAFEGLLTGNINFIKLSKTSSDFSIRFFEEFFKDPVARTWQNLLIVAKVSSSEKELLCQVLNEADGVVAWGGEESLSEIRKMIPSRARLIEWGHRISFSYLTQKKQTDANIFEQITNDVFLFDQQACSSPQCLFLEDASFEQLEKFANELRQAFERRSKLENLNLPSGVESAEISRCVLVLETEKALATNFTAVIEDANKKWRILIDSRPGLRASPLYRSIWLKPIKRENILATLRPLSQYLQTVGLGCERGELYELMQEFFKAGVTRVRPLGKMLESYAGEPHDGVLALTRYMKKVSIEQNCGLENYATLDDLHLNRIELIDLPKKLMSKDDFQKMSPPPDAAELYFKSGGSSGEPKISVFTYLDYHRQMKFAADGLLAAGLNPAKDKCMNLFFSGGLYGSFLSIFSVLEDLKAIQFPMTAHMDFEFVANTIVKNNVNVLLGMPSYLTMLFDAQSNLFKKHQCIEKIFYGGEAFNRKQIERLKVDFAIDSIISATYGSVDMGPLGYQCTACRTGVHHLHQNLHHLEILDLENDQSVSPGQVGRMVFTSYGRQGLNLLRYDLGDLGAWVDEPCECGRQAPRFELLGRHGDIFRAAGAFLNYNKFAQILSNEFSYSHEFQIILRKPDKLDQIHLVIDQLAISLDPELNVDKIKHCLLSKYPDLKELVTDESSLELKIAALEKTQFLRSPGSGKLFRIIDQRGK